MTAPRRLEYRIGFCQDESNESHSGSHAWFAGEGVHFYSQQVKGAALVALVAPRDVPPGCLHPRVR